MAAEEAIAARVAVTMVVIVNFILTLLVKVVATDMFDSVGG